MPKVMLVEDDNNLREIYDARLAAEGYEIVSAHDGEEALALAVKEKPDLIISDVMMPKISGFDMLDILRSTPETKNTKVIMMTALSQAEDRERAGKLGADRYLVKSQVTLEDVIKVAHEILNDTGAAPVPPPADISAGPAPDPSVKPITPTMTNDAPVAAPPEEPAASATPTPTPAAAPAATPPTASPVPATPAEPAVATPAPNPTPASTPVEEPAASAPAAPAPSNDAPTVTASPGQPITVSTEEDKPAEQAPSAPMQEPTATAPPVPEATPTPSVDPALSQTKSEETNGVEKQIQDFIANNPTLTTATDADKPAEPAAAPASTNIPVSTPPEEPAASAPAVPSAEPPVATPAPTPEATVTQEQLANPSLTSSSSAPEPPSHRKLVLTPTDKALEPPVDLNALLEKENAKENVATPVETPPTNTIIAPAPEADDAPTTTVSPNDISL